MPPKKEKKEPKVKVPDGGNIFRYNLDPMKGRSVFDSNCAACHAM